jgi:uncharacterized membrane protein HdeD (DUF308 family)
MKEHRGVRAADPAGPRDLGRQINVYSLIVRGMLAVIVGIIAATWPSITVFALVIVFAVYAFLDAGLEIAQVFGSRAARSVLGHLLLVLIDIAAGIVALAWPGPTALVLTIVVAAWSFLGGFFELFAASQIGDTPGTRAMLILAGLVSIAFGVVIAARPGIGAITLALLFGLYSLIFGVWEIVAGVDLRHSRRHLRSIMPDSV